MNVLVTGGTGFTGSALVMRLLELGHNVRTIDYQEGIRLGQLKEAGAEVRIGSITDKGLVDNAIEGMDFVFHIAAAFREMDVKDEHYYNVNVNGTRNVMEAAVKHNIKKIVYCSTQGVHGRINNPPGDENSPIAPEDYYQQTKYEGEVVVREFIKNGMKATIIRPTAIYGPGDPERFFMIFKRAVKGYFLMFGKGETFYHPVYIDNLVDSFILCMDPDKGNGETYIIADEKYYPIKELVKRVGKSMGIDVNIKYYPIIPLVVAGHVVEKVCKPFGIAPPIFPRRVDWFRQVRAFKIDKAKKELGYQPKVDIDEGLKKTAEWYREKGYLNWLKIFIIVFFISSLTCTEVKKQYSLPEQEDWLDHGSIITAGENGTWDFNLEGMISPCTMVKKDNIYFLYYLGADGYRSFDNGPRHRALGVATSSNGLHFTKYHDNPIIEFLPQKNEEEGIFSAAACLDENGNITLYYGAMTAVNPTATIVNSSIRLAESNDGFNFTDMGTVLSYDDPEVWGYGDELFPVGVYRVKNNWYLYYLAGGKDVTWGLGVAWGSNKKNLSDTKEIIDEEEDYIGACQPFELTQKEIGFFILRGFDSRNIEIWLADKLHPVDLYISRNIYTFSGLLNFAHFLDRESDKWFLYYLSDNSIKLKTVSYNSSLKP